jgi:hypothetical protein
VRLDADDRIPGHDRPARPIADHHVGEQHHPPPSAMPGSAAMCRLQVVAVMKALIASWT